MKAHSFHGLDQREESNMRKTLGLLVALLLAFSLAACGSGGNKDSGGGSSAPSGSASPGQITLRVAWWGSQPRHDYTLQVIEMYEKANPHVKIEPEYASWDDYWKRLAPQAAGGELPDVIQMDLSYITQYGQKGQLEDLTPYLNKEIDISDISESAISGGRVGDKLYGFNLGVNALQVHYDPELLKKIGLDKLPDDWTWDTYKELGQKAKEAGLYFETGLRPEVFFAYYLRQHGQHLYSEDGTSLGYDDDQLFIDYFTMTRDMTLMGASPTPDVQAQIKGIEDDPLVKNQAISVWQWSNQFVGLQQAAGRPLEMHPLPGPNVKQGMFLKPSMFFSVASNSKHKEEAAKFINFFVNDIEANKLIKGDRGVPVAGKVKEALKPLLPPELQKVFDYITWAEQNSSPADPPDPIGAAEVMALFKTYDEQMKFKQITPEEAAKRFRQEANEILARNNQ
jgi:multiple sugar transport system substrate-binding protein